MEGANQKNYRQAFKAFSILGSIQVFTILISILKSKFVAVLLGASGVGVIGLLQSATDLLSALTGMGVNYSSIRNIAEVNGTGDGIKLGKVIYVVRRVIWITGLLGVCVTLIFAGQLSEWTFGHTDYTKAFIFLSVILLLKAISGGQFAIIQGLRKVGYLAKSNLWGALAGLFLSVPLYYWWGEKGIVPSLVLTAAVTLLASFWYSKKLNIRSLRTNYREFVSISGNILKIGILMTLSGSILTSLMSYVLKSYLSHTGSMVDVGFYQAAWALLNGYVGVIFTAMGTDYYPRLAEVNGDNQKMGHVVNQQMEMSVLILAPILSILLVGIQIIVPLLYTKEFGVIIPLICWALCGMFFKAVAFCISYVFIAKAAVRIFVITEVVSQILILVLSVVGYAYFGLKGMGYAFTVSHFLYVLIVCYFIRKRYSFSFDRTVLKNMVLLFVSYNILFCSYMFIASPYNYMISIAMALGICFISYRKLNARLDLHSMINRILNNIKYLLRHFKVLNNLFQGDDKSNK